MPCTSAACGKQGKAGRCPSLHTPCVRPVTRVIRHPLCAATQFQPQTTHSQELEADEHVKEGHAGAVTLRSFKNAAGSLRGDLSEGSDSWAVGQGWVAVTPICLRSGKGRRAPGGGGKSRRSGGAGMRQGTTQEE